MTTKKKTNNILGMSPDTQKEWTKAKQQRSQAKANTDKQAASANRKFAEHIKKQKVK